MDREKWLAVAIEEARKGRKEGGIPIGSVLVDKDGVVVARGHNMRVQVIHYGFLLTSSLVSRTLKYRVKGAHRIRSAHLNIGELK